MKTIDWSQNYEVGVIDIDVDHRKLFSAYNTFVENIEKKTDLKYLQKEFDELANTLEKHFGYEEGILKSMNCATLKQHHEIHVRLIGELRKFQAKMAKAHKDTGFSVNKFADDFRQWMLDHIAEDGEDFQQTTRTGSIQSNSAV